MRILLAAPSDAYSRINFIEQFRRMGHEVTHWDFTTQKLCIPDGERYDLFFHILVNDEVTPGMLADLKSIGIVDKTLLWASDNEWRLPVSLARAGNYDFCTSNDPDAIPLYRAKGFDHVRLVPYGVNVAALLRPQIRKWETDTVIYALDYLKQPYDVSFVGQAYIVRPDFIAGLADRGIKVNVWGQGFSNQPLPHDRMIETLCSSKIVLGMNWVAGGPQAGHGFQIKGRLFETAALGCFQLVNAGKQLYRYFNPSEIATYTSLDDCADKIRYYLERPEEREKIALAGQRRTLNEHTWEKRWATAIPELFA